MKINHVSICVRDLDKALEKHKEIFQIEKVEDFGTVTHGGVKAAGLSIGDFVLEFVQPLGPGAHTRFLDRRGEGMHHISFTVDDVERVRAHLLAKDIPLVDQNFRSYEDARYIFVRPSAANGVLIEFVSRGVV